LIGLTLLLDTHCLIWLLADSPRLGQAARRQISDAESVRFSDASIWELGLKWRKGKIAIEPRRDADQALKNGLRPLAIEREALLPSCEWKREHAAHFDRLLHAQARHDGLRLLTIDRNISAVDSRAVLAPAAPPRRR
jgi:PIN domain nuclease of toxin-antitoxin system